MKTIEDLRAAKINLEENINILISCFESDYDTSVSIYKEDAVYENINIDLGLKKVLLRHGKFNVRLHID